jgi:hypothetical protein
MVPKTVGSIVALFVVAICFAACYGQQQIRVCEDGECPIVQLPAARVDPPAEVIVSNVPAFPQVTYYETASPRTMTTRQGLFGRVRLFQRLKGICCRR